METIDSSIKPEDETLWKVGFTSAAEKQKNSLPKMMKAKLLLLVSELKMEGPVQPEWHHYGKLAGKKNEVYHCHLNKGKPRYVAVWEVIDRTVRVIKIRYAGTHEKVNYDHY